MFKILFLSLNFTLILSSATAQILTNGEVYDMAVGDKLAYTEYVYRGSSGPPLYVFKKVISKEVFNRDSLHITFYVGTYGYEVPSWVNRSYIEMLSIHDLDSPYFKNFGKQDTFFQFYDRSDTLKQHPYGYSEFKDSINQDSCGTVLNVRYRYSMALLSGHTMESINVYKSLGILKSNSWSDGGNVYGSEKYINYYYHNNQYCGSKSFPVNLDHPIWLQLSVSPNPAANALNVQLPLSGFYSIKNTLGQSVLSGQLNCESSDQKIDISDIDSGVYTLELQSAQQSYTARFIKQ